MRKYFASRLFTVGFVGLAAGTGPLVGIILLAAIGLWPDPEPNPIGPGLLSFLTFWPSVVCLVLGARQVRRKAA
jgi:hypothetical protein